MDILIVERLHFSSDYIYHADRHNDYEINYVENGRCMMNLDDQKVVLREGDCIVIPPMFLHNFLFEHQILLIFFDNLFLSYALFHSSAIPANFSGSSSNTPAHRPSSHTKYPFSVMESSVRELL